MGSSKNNAEGVIKFKYELIDSKLPCKLFSDLMEWRNELWRHNLIGMCNDIGHGNASKRMKWNSKRGFVITGSQTGHIAKLPCEKYCFIESYNIEKNSVRAFGKVKPSSEALSHASIYEQNEKINAVVHSHSKEIFAASKALGLPYTSEKASYGSIALAKELAKAFEEFNLGEEGIIVTLGHKEGVFSWAGNIARASEIIISTLEKARELL